MSDFARGMLHAAIGHATAEIVVASKAYGAHVYDDATIRAVEDRLDDLRSAIERIENTICAAKADHVPKFAGAAE